MSASSQLFIATLLSAVAFGCFAFAAGFAGRPIIAAVLAALVWLLVAVAVAFLVTVEVIAALPPEYQPERGPTKELSPRFYRTVVNYPTLEPSGTIIIDTPNTYLYLTLGNGKAIRYGVGVGREGFTWSGTERISRMKEWPDWCRQRR